MRVSGSATRGVSVALLVMMMIMIQLKTSSSSVAALYNKSNNSNTAGRLIADDLELEFLMDSEVRRMLGAHISPGTLAKDQSSAGCGRGKNYIPCVPGKNGVQRPPDEHCDDPYNAQNRGCRPRP